jgi:hypothetical protein
MKKNQIVQPASSAAPCSAAEEEAELVTFEWFAMAHPHEAYAAYPARFWLLFQIKCPGKTRAEMEKILAATDEPPNA